MNPDVITQLRKEGYPDAEIAEEFRKSNGIADTLLKEGYNPTEVLDELNTMYQREKPVEAKEPSIPRILAGIAAQTAIEEGAKVGGTAAGTGIGAAVGSPTGPGAVGTATLGAGIGYVSGVITGGVAGSIAAQEIEGRPSISWGRVASDTLLNFIPGTELQHGPKLLRAASRQLAKHPVLGTAVLQGTATPAAVSLERYMETGEMPPNEELMKLGIASSVLGGSLGWSSGKGVDLLRKFAGKPPKMIDDMAASGSRGAVAYINALTENVDPREFMTRENVGKYISSLADNTKARLAPSKLVGKDATQAIIDAKNIVSAGREVGGLLGDRVQSAISKSQDPAATRTLVVDYLGGKIPNLPPGMKNLQSDLSFARNKIRQYQQELLDNHYSGQRILPDPMRIQIEDSMNQGDYLTRSYRFFEDAEFKPARNHLDSLKARLASDGMDQKQIDQYISELNAKRASTPDELQSWVVSQNAGILKEKKDLAPELRRYLGEYVEPGEQIAATMSKLSRLTGYDAADATIARSLADIGVLKRAGTDLPEGYMPITLRRGNAQIQGEELYGPPELQVAINQLYGVNADGKAMDLADNLASDLWETGVSLSKASKVLGNPPSYAVQAYSNFINLLGMGMNPLKGLGKGTKMGAAQFSDTWVGKIPVVSKLARDMDIPSLEAFMKGKELGLVPPGVVFSDIQAGMKGRTFGSKANAIVNPFGKLYSVPDIAFRMAAFENHQAFLRKAFPGASDADTEKMAAQITNGVYQNYDYLNSNLKTMSRKGVPLGQFASFSLELIRNQYNQGVLIKKMLDGSFANEAGGKLGVPANKLAIQKEGLKRLAALSTVYAGTAAGIGLYNRKSYTEEEERAIRETGVPDWDANRQLVLKHGKDGKIYWTNSSYVVPHMQAAAPILSALRGESFKDAFDKVIVTAGEDMLGEGSFMMNSLSQALNNHSYKTGRSISVSSDGTQKAADISSWFIGDLFEPGVVREIEKARTQPLKVTAARQVGFRANSTTIEDAFRYKAGDIRIALNTIKADASFIANRLEKGKITPEEYQSERARLNESYKQNLAVLNRHVENIKTLSPKFNLTEDGIIKMMRDNGLGAETALYAINGIVNDLPDKRGMSVADQHEAMLTMETGERMKKITEMAKDDPSLARGLVMREREYQRDKMLKMNERDKAVKALSVEDGQRARYIVEEMKRSQFPLIILDRYRKKGLTPPEVEKEISKFIK